MSIPSYPLLAKGRHSVALDIGDSFKGAYEARYEYQLKPCFLISGMIDLEAFRFGFLQDATHVIATRGAFPDFLIEAGVGAKWFFWDAFYLEPHIKLGHARISRHMPIGDMDYFVVQPGIYVGYQLTFDFGLLLNLGAGFSGRIFFPMTEQPIALPELLIALGYAW